MEIPGDLNIPAEPVHYLKYLDDRSQKVEPANFIDELYRVRQKRDFIHRSTKYYAVDFLVSIKAVDEYEESPNLFLVSFSFKDERARRRLKAEGLIPQYVVEQTGVIVNNYHYSQPINLDSPIEGGYFLRPPPAPQA